MKLLSRQHVWPARTVVELLDAGSELDVTFAPMQSRISLTRAQARRLGKALLKWADGKRGGGR